MSFDGTDFQLPVLTTTASAANLNWDSATYRIRTVSSLRKSKRDFQKIDGALAKVLALQPWTFLSAIAGDDQSRRIAGFVVEEFLESGLEDWVVYDAEGNAISLMYDRIAALLAAGFQEFQSDVEMRLSRLEKA
jgi:hypothetical protein